MEANGKISVAAAATLVLAALTIWTSGAQADHRRDNDDHNRSWTRNDDHRGDRDRGNWDRSGGHRGDWDRDRGNFRPGYSYSGSYYRSPVIVERPVYYSPSVTYCPPTTCYRSPVTYYSSSVTYCNPPVYYAPRTVVSGSGIYLNFRFGD